MRHPRYPGKYRPHRKAQTLANTKTIFRYHSIRESFAFQRKRPGSIMFLCGYRHVSMAIATFGLNLCSLPGEPAKHPGVRAHKRATSHPAACACHYTTVGTVGKRRLTGRPWLQGVMGSSTPLGSTQAGMPFQRPSRSRKETITDGRQESLL